LERRVAERTAQLEKANKELESFSYSVSHDLRAPLRSIDGFSQSLLEDCAGKLDPRSTDYLHRVRASAQRMGELIDDLLQLSRVGRAELRREPVDISELARTVVGELLQREPDRQVEVEIEEALVAEVDSRLMRVVLDNLLGNAWKFTAKAARPRVQVSSDRAADGPVYFVRDNGAGFDMAYADKLFLPFQRLHRECEFPGTGIGLATIHRIIDRHGGRVWAEGAVGRGATIYFTVPRSASGDRS
jgi:light-regulated signal transduction histidine kinase (bacteriophytochrome)